MPPYTGLLDDGDELRAGQHHGDHRGQPGGAQLSRSDRAAGQPDGQHQHRGDDDQDGDLLIGEHGRGQHHAEDGGLAPARAAGQPDRGFQRDRDEQLTCGQVQVVPGPPHEHGGQAEERARGDRAGLGTQPQPGRPVSRVAQQPRHGHRQQVVGRGRAEHQGHRREQHPRQRHQRMQAQLCAHRRGDGPGEPRIAQMHQLMRDPPETPHIRAGIPGGGQPARQVGRPGPAHRHPSRQVPGQHQQMNQDWAGCPRPRLPVAGSRCGALRPGRELTVPG